MAWALAAMTGVATTGTMTMLFGEGSTALAQEEAPSDGFGGLAMPEGLPGETSETATGRPVWRIVPSISVSERYDSNVFFVPGPKTNDFVTTVYPQIRLEEQARLITGSLQAGATGEVYVNNPELNYIGVNANLDLSLDNAVKRLFPRASLRITDYFIYTPQPPAFLSPQAQLAGQSNVFATGIQVVRADSIQNTATVTGAYTLTPIVSLRGSYAYGFIDFGDSLATPAEGTLFDTSYQNATLGINGQVTRRDSVNVNYTYTKSNFGAGSGGVSEFTTHGILLGWNHAFTPTLRGALTGGPTATDVGTGSVPLAFTGTASLTWTQRAANFTFLYTRAVTPSYSVAATALISDTVGVSIASPLTARLSMSAVLNYARNESEVNQVPLSYESYGGTITFTYALAPRITALASYSYNWFNQTFETGTSQFDRQLATLTIRAEWR